MISIAEAQQRVGRLYERRFPEWAVWGAESAVVDIPLHPPTQDHVLTDASGVRDWIQRWRSQERSFGDGARISWESRQWANAGTQRLPVRLVLEAPQHAAAFISRSAHWKAARSRCAALRELLEARRRAPAATPVETIPDVLRRRMKKIAELDHNDYLRLRDSLTWVLENPEPGVYPRQMPIRGVDSKWLEKHSSLVEPLYAAATGTSSLGLLAPPAMVRIRALDAALAPGGLRDIAAPADQLSRLAWEPRGVVMVENLQTLLALPELDGVVAIHSAGYAARKLTDISWLSETRIIYWGDLDVDGFRILSMVRSSFDRVQSVLMDRSTLTAHLDLSGPDRRDAPRGLPEHLTAAERDAFSALADHGHVRLEQERIPWQYALGRLHHALAAW